MLKFILRRLLNYLLLLVVAVTLAYFIAGTQLDPRSMLIEAEITSGKNIPYEEVVRTVDQRLTGWNINPTDPILDRFFNWVGMISHWDWGHSPLGNSVNAEIANRVPISLQLVFLGFFIGIIGGVSLGAWAAVHQYSKRDRLITIIAMVIISTPAMVIAVFLQIGATYANNFAGYQLFNFIGPTSAIPPTGFSQHC